LDCGTPQSIGEPTFESLSVVTDLLGRTNPHISSYLFATFDPYDVHVHYTTIDPLR
jgi:hypothetical protein